MAGARYLFCANCSLQLATYRVVRVKDDGERCYGVCDRCLGDLRSEAAFEKVFQVHRLPVVPAFVDERWNKTPASLVVSLPVTVGELAGQLGVKSFEIIAMLISKKCFLTAEKPLPREALQWVAEHYDTEILVAER